MISLFSISLVLPTVAIFVNDDDEFFLLGYSTESIYGSFLSLTMILVWVKTYHLVCRDVYQIFVNYTSTYARVFAVTWALVGTGLVLLWVSSAFVLHLAVTYRFQLKKEKSFWDLKCVQKSKKRLRESF